MYCSIKVFISTSVNLGRFALRIVQKRYGKFVAPIPIWHRGKKQACERPLALPNSQPLDRESVRADLRRVYVTRPCVRTYMYRTRPLHHGHLSAPWTYHGLPPPLHVLNVQHNDVQLSPGHWPWLSSCRAVEAPSRRCPIPPYTTHNAICIFCSGSSCQDALCVSV